MIKLLAKPRKITGKKVKNLRKEGLLPAVLYGPGVENKMLEVQLGELEKAFKEAGENTLINLEVGSDKNYSVLIHNIKKNPLTETPIHVDFYQPALDKKIEGEIPIILEGEAPAVKSLGGTLIKNIVEIKVRALPQNLPKEFKADIAKLRTLEDYILIKDLKVPEGVEILKDPDTIIAQVVPPEKVEEELAKPIEEKIEEVEKVEKKEEKEAAMPEEKETKK